MAYIQAHMVEGGSMFIFKHRIRTDSYLNAFSEGHFMAISSIHQFSTPTYSCSWEGWGFSQHAPWTSQQSISRPTHNQTFALTCHLEFTFNLQIFWAYLSIWQKMQTQNKRVHGWSNSSSYWCTALLGYLGKQQPDYQSSSSGNAGCSTVWPQGYG